MKIGFETIIFGPIIKDLESALDTISQSGYEGIEFSQRPDMLFMRGTSGPIPVKIEQLVSLLEDRNLVFLGLAGGTLEERIRFCKPNGGESKPELLPSYLYVEDCNAMMLEMARELGVKLALHPHVFMQNHHLIDALKLLERFPDLLWMPDTAHLYIVGDDPIKAVSALPHDRFSCVHLKDWDAAYGRSYYRYAKGFTELGTGNVPVTEVLQELRSSNYKGWIVVEQDYTRTTPAQSALMNAYWLASQGSAMEFVDRRTEIPPTETLIEPLPQSAQDCSPEEYAYSVAKAKFTRAMLRASSEDISRCYQTLAGAMRELCDCHIVTVWACSPTRDDLSLLAVSPTTEQGPNIISKREALAGSAIEQLALKAYNLNDEYSPSLSDNAKIQFQWHERAHQLGSTVMIAMPVLNLFNAHHLRLFVGLLPRSTWLTSNDPAPYWYTQFADLNMEIAQAADASLDSLCAYAAARVNILAGNHHNVKKFLDAIRSLIQELANCEGITIFLVNATRDRLEERTTTGIVWQVPEEEQYYTKDVTTQTGRVWMENEPVLLRDAQIQFVHQPRSRESGPSVDLHRDNLLFVPLVDTQGNVIGIIRCRNKRPPSRAIDSISGAHISSPSRSNTEPAEQEWIFTDDDAALVDVIGHSAVPHLQVLQSDEQRARSVASMTHELSMPLVAIRSSVDWLREDLSGMPPVCSKSFTYDYAGDIDSWSLLMVGLLSNAEVYSLKAQTLRLNPSPVFLMADIIAPAVRQVGQLVRARNFSTRNVWYSDFEDIPRLYIDKNRFQQVIFNLLSNAIKYAYNDPAQFQVEINGTVRERLWYDITFKDWGPGIVKEHEVSIFEESVRGPKAVNDYVAGQGLGLWIVKRIVEAHGGIVRVTHNFRPTELTISLPTSLASAPPRKLARTSKESA